MQFVWPLDDPIITRGFHYKAAFYVGGQHAALDFIRVGTTRDAPIRAVAVGAVAQVSADSSSGYFVAVDHIDGWRSVYRHLIRPASVIVGQQVRQGQIIGNVGNTGWSSGDHLHFDLWNRDEVRDDDAIFYKNGWYAVDPELYLGQEDDDMGMTPDEKIELRLLRTQVNVMIGQIGQLLEHGPHYGFQQIADNLPDLNQHLRRIVVRLADASREEHGHKVVIPAQTVRVE